MPGKNDYVPDSDSELDDQPPAAPERPVRDRPNNGGGDRDRPNNGGGGGRPGGYGDRNGGGGRPPYNGGGGDRPNTGGGRPPYNGGGGDRPNNGGGRPPYNNGGGDRPNNGGSRPPFNSNGGGGGDRPNNSGSSRPPFNSNGGGSGGDRPNTGANRPPFNSTGGGDRPNNGGGRPPYNGGGGDRPNNGGGRPPYNGGGGDRPGGFNGGGGGGRPPFGGGGDRPGGGRPPFGGGGGGGGGRPNNFASPPAPAEVGRDKKQSLERDRERQRRNEKEFERDGSAAGGVRRGAEGGRPTGNGSRPGIRSGGGVASAPQRPVGRTGIIKRIEVYELPPQMTVAELADELGIGSGEIIRELIKNGVMASINQQIDYDTAEIVASELGFETTLLVPAKEESDEVKIPSREEIASDPDAVTRPPVVTIMGHVDHGKTKLLDAIRSTNVVAAEAGGITQRIGAYQVEIDGKKITFVDTPGHEAFTGMRARGAQVTDIVILVVAADDGVMPQTLEALSHAKAANVPIIVAINKIDREGANQERVKTQLSEAGLQPEEWGGETPFVPVSAKEKIGINDLLEMILLVAELGDLKANPDKLAIGTVVEAELDKNRGPVATVLIQNGTLSERDYIVVGSIYGKARALMDDRGKKIRKAPPSFPVQILGLEDVPKAGDIAQVVEDEKTS